MRHASLLIRRNELFAQLIRTKSWLYREDVGMPTLTYGQALVADELVRLSCALMNLWDLEVEKYPVPKYYDAPIELPELSTQLVLERDHTEEWPPDYCI